MGQFCCRSMPRLYMLHNYLCSWSKNRGSFKRKIHRDCPYFPSICYTTFSGICYHMHQIFRIVKRKGRAGMLFNFFCMISKKLVCCFMPKCIHSVGYWPLNLCSNMWEQWPIYVLSRQQLLIKWQFCVN